MMQFNSRIRSTMKNYGLILCGLKRNEPLEHKKDKAEPEKERTADMESIKQSSESEKKWTAERKKYQAEPE